MTDPRMLKHADILVNYSTDIQPGDRVVIEATTAAEPMLEALIERVLEAGGYPYLITKLPREEAIFYKYARKPNWSRPRNSSSWLTRPSRPASGCTR